MKRDVRSPTFPIWLLGDSNPKQWEHVLETPLDPRHPAIHNIWTPVLDVIQDRVFREGKWRVDALSLYIRNAIEDPGDKPLSNEVRWSEKVEGEARVLQRLIDEHVPAMLLCFGAFSFEFARRALCQSPERAYAYWRARRLGEEFRHRISEFDIATTNVLPLLHVSIARGRFLQSHEYFCDRKGANYFKYVGERIAAILIEHRSSLEIWIE